MQDLTTGDHIQFRVWCLQAEQASVNTFNFAVGAVTGTVTDLDAAQAFDALVAPLYKPILQNNASYRGVQCRFTNKLPLPIPQSTNANAGAGTGGAIGLPRQTAGITQWLTAKAGPGFRGRTYWPFPASASDFSAGSPTAAYLTAVEDLVVAIQGFNLISIGGGDDAAVTFGLKVKASPFFIPIDQGLTHPLWATQRRRGAYGRANGSPV